MATLLDIRKRLVTQSGHHELVVDAAAGDWSDNGADEYINDGQDFLDEMFDYRKEDVWFVQTCMANNPIMYFKNSRVVKQVFLVDEDGRKELYGPVQDDWGRVQADFDKTKPGTPLYWSNPSLGLAPSLENKFFKIDSITLVDGNPVQVATDRQHGFSGGETVYFNGAGGTTELNGNSYTVTVVDPTTITLDGTLSENFTAYTENGWLTNDAEYKDVSDLDEMIFGQHYLTKAIRLMPTPDKAYTVQILGSFWSKQLINDTDESYWSADHPSLLIKAARMEMEHSLHRNSSGAEHYRNEILARLKKIEHSFVEEEAQGPPEMWRMFGQ